MAHWGGLGAGTGWGFVLQRLRWGGHLLQVAVQPARGRPAFTQIIGLGSGWNGGLTEARGASGNVPLQWRIYPEELVAFHSI